MEQHLVNTTFSQTLLDGGGENRAGSKEQAVFVVIDRMT
jgi:hypothetical protein